MPDVPSIAELLRTGLECLQRGELAQAEALYRQVLEREPANADALHLAGLAAYQRGDAAAGVDLIQRAIAAQPGAGVFWGNLAALLEQLGRRAEAAGALERAAALGQAGPDTQARLARLWRAAPDRPKAVAAYRRALEREPGRPELWLELAETLFDERRFAECEGAARQALAVEPHSTAGRLRLAAALLAQEQPAAALGELAAAQQLMPDSAAVHSLRGVALLSLGQVHQATRALRRALKLEPELASARYNLGVGLLLSGKLKAGWPLYEARGADVFFRRRRPEVDAPVWTGQRLGGRRILLQAEQGLGDAIQFVRYAPLVAERGGQVIVECLPPLRRLFERLPGVSGVVTTDERLPPIDTRIAMLSLPAAFGTGLRTVPADVPYLHAPAAAEVRWRERLGTEPGLKIGLAWQGSAANVHNARRSIAAGQLAELTDTRQARFFSLQKHEPGTERALPSNTRDLEPLLTDLAETAAAITCLDLVITVDTVVAHLAGALGRPVWIMLPFVPDWRWLMNRSDSPWYPTARLFRQPSAGDWASVVRQVRRALEEG